MKAQRIGKAVAVSVTMLLMVCAMFTVTPIEAQELPDQPSGSQPLPEGVIPDLYLDTKPFLSFTPNPIGLDQNLLVNVWMQPALITSRYFTGYRIILTDPYGTEYEVTTDSYRGDTTAWFLYPMVQVGTWKVKFEFPGGYFPAGLYYGEPGVYGGEGPFAFNKSVYYKPSSTPEMTLIVQQDPVYSWPPSPLPTDYWTRPIYSENREWWIIAGAYPGTGYPGADNPIWDELYPSTNQRWSRQYNFHPWVIGSDTNHVVWKKQTAVAGLIGGPAGQYAEYARASNPSVVYAGRAYHTYNKPGVGSVAACYDLRTGEIFYEIPTAQGGVTPTIVAYGKRGDPMMTQAEAFWSPTAELLSISGGYLRKVDPWTGSLTLNQSIAPLTGSGGTYYMNHHVLAVQDLGAAAGADRYRLLNWTAEGPQVGFGGVLYGVGVTFESRIISNTSYARRNLPALIDWNVGIGVDLISISNMEATRAPNSTRTTAYDLYTGQQLWTDVIDEELFIGSVAVADHGKVAWLTRGAKDAVGGYFVAYDLETGQIAWKSEKMDYPWGEAAFGAYAIASAYGMFYRAAMDGVYAFDWETGKIVWKYVAPALAAFESPYISEEGGVACYPFFSTPIIADGKMYIYNTEHTPSHPNARGWGLHCINITTGKGIWNITGQMTPGAIADGYLTASNANDGYMYVFGKGQSATTVSASPKIIANGDSVLIEGRVTDESPAQPGTPCVSKESMSEWMEYLHMQKPMPADVTGVPVDLIAVHEDGTYINIGTATSDLGGFRHEWTPPDEGIYTITASFNGDESYGSSWATADVLVTPEPPAPGEEEPEEEPAYTAVDLAIIAAVVVAIIIGIVNLWALRKRT